MALTRGLLCIKTKWRWLTGYLISGFHSAVPNYRNWSLELRVFDNICSKGEKVSLTYPWKFTFQLRYRHCGLNQWPHHRLDWDSETIVNLPSLVNSWGQKFINDFPEWVGHRQVPTISWHKEIVHNNNWRNCQLLLAAKSYLLCNQPRNEGKWMSSFVSSAAQ